MDAFNDQTFVETISFAKVNTSSVYVSTGDVVVAINKTTNKSSRGFFCTNGEGRIEFEIDQNNWNVYKGTVVSASATTLAYEATINFSNTSDKAYVCLSEAAEGEVRTEISAWPNIFTIQ